MPETPPLLRDRAQFIIGSIAGMIRQGRASRVCVCDERVVL